MAEEKVEEAGRRRTQLQKVLKPSKYMLVLSFQHNYI